MSEKLFGLEFEKKSVELFVRKGRGKFMMIGIVGKDGKLRKYIMKEVEKWLGEEGGEEDSAW